jgi:hypothetical protein
MNENETVEELKKMYEPFKIHELTELSEEDFIQQHVNYIFNHSVREAWDRDVADGRLKHLADELTRTLRS